VVREGGRERGGREEGGGDVNVCAFCNTDHPDGVPQSMLSQGHPYLAQSRRYGGFAYFVNGTELSQDEYEKAREAWQKRTDPPTT
jgi:hypothetical protein